MSEELKPDAVGFDVTAIEMPGVPNLKGFSVEDRGEFYELVLGPNSPTTNLPLHSRIDFSLIYFSKGKPFKFEDQAPPALHLYHTSKLLAESKAGSVSIGPGKGATMKTEGEHICNWSPRWEETGGMDPTLKITDKANEQFIQVTVEVPMAGVRDKPLRLPKAS